MLLFLHGPDTYRSRQKLNEIIARYKKTLQARGEVTSPLLNLQFFDLTEKKFDEFRDSLRHQPMFKEKKLFILTEPFSEPEFCQEFLKEKEAFLNSEDLIVFYQSGSAPKNNKFFKFLKTNTKSQEFNLLSGLALSAWAEKEIRTQHLKIEGSALNKLLGFVGNDLWRLSNEIKKLAAYGLAEVGSPPVIIKTEDIELLVRPRIETNIFKTIEAIAGKNKRLAFSLLREHLTKGDSPLYLLSMIHYQFRNLLIVKDLLVRQVPYDQVSRISRLQPFVLKKSIFLAAKFSLAELKKIYQRIFEADLAIKTGKVEPELALDLLIAEM